MGREKRPAIGTAKFKIVATERYCVDKTLLIKELLDRSGEVTLFTRPRRFGKSLNMDMLRVFFERTNEDTSDYFRDLEIWKCGEKYRKEQGTRPVVYLSFHNFEGIDWETAQDNLLNTLKEEVGRHIVAVDRKVLNMQNQIRFDDLRKFVTLPQTGKVSYIFQTLCRLLCEYYSREAVVFVDEYDRPMEEGMLGGYYPEITRVMRGLLTSIFKNSEDIVKFGCLTGIRRVAKEGLFSGLNNLRVDTVLSDWYSEFFGYTVDEVAKMAQYYGVEDRMDEIREWYEGYLFGRTEIYNPWSVNSYFDNNCRPEAYWTSTSSNQIIARILLQDKNPDTLSQFEQLLAGACINTPIDMDAIYPKLGSSPAQFWTLLLMAGHLTTCSASTQHAAHNMHLRIPNLEILQVFGTDICGILTDAGIKNCLFEQIAAAFINYDCPHLTELLKELLVELISFYDAAAEGYYHGLLLGLLSALLANRYRAYSNIESGNGRSDITLRPLDMENPGLIIEVKSGRTEPHKDLRKLAGDGLRQLNDSDYAAVLRREGLSKILKYGIAFRGKDVHVVGECDGY